MKILVVVAHPDDECLMAGGTIAKHVEAGDEVFVLMIADGVTSRDGCMPSEAKARLKAASLASDVLGCNGDALGWADQRIDTVAQLELNKVIEHRVREFSPEIVYTHWHNDMNLDHALVAAACKIACRPTPGSSVKQLLMGEVPSSTEWAGGFNPSVFVDIRDQVTKKWQALECYGLEMRSDNHPRSFAAIAALQAYRGATVGVPAAEAFECLRQIR